MKATLRQVFDTLRPSVVGHKAIDTFRSEDLKVI